MRRHNFASSVLREYDIRGTYGEDLNRLDACALGYALADMGRRDNYATVCVGRDGRHSSPPLYEALVSALADSGMRVIGIGACASPELYFATLEAKADIGVMITGSHGAASRNGFKITYGGRPFFGDAIQGMARAASVADWRSIEGGSFDQQNMRPAYIKRLLLEFSDLPPLRVAFDPANGALCWALRELLPNLAGDSLIINGDIDGNFSAHAPDPSRAENLQQLRSVVLDEGCDFGVGFDGDGDRIGVVDDCGVILWMDSLLPLYAGSVLAENSGCAVIADVKALDSVFSTISGLGGRAIMSAVGHSIIKQRMIDEGALLGAEVSGHVYFADRYYGYDDALYAGLRLWELVCRSGCRLSELREKYPVDVALPEIRVDILESRKFAVMQEIATYAVDSYGDAGVELIDGVRVRLATAGGGVGGGWWLIRASKTESVLSIRAAGYDRISLAESVNSLCGVLEFFAIDTAPIRRAEKAFTGF